MSEEKEGNLAQKIVKVKESNQVNIDNENKTGFAQLAVQELTRLNGQEKSLSQYSMPGKQ